ncbi:MAG: hypothetical protein JXB36_08350, partial [Gammaproteobacteria bacterium]|nr:hypothetical protein [Gammaproteobacteria bacterium]
ATVDRSRAGRNGRGRLAAGVAAAAAAGLLLWGLARDVAPPRPDTPPAAATTPAGESTPTPDPTANPSPLVIAPDAHPAASGDPAAESPDVAAALVSSGSEAAGAAPSHAALLVESARLERLLEALPRQRPIMTAGTAGTIAALEDRIYFIDGQLTLGAAQGLEPKQQLALWRERIDVMDALVKVRYAQAQPLIY